jgi:hypothetical protein
LFNIMGSKILLNSVQYYVHFAPKKKRSNKEGKRTT